MPHLFLDTSSIEAGKALMQQAFTFRECRDKETTQSQPKYFPTAASRLAGVGVVGVALATPVSYGLAAGAALSATVSAAIVTLKHRWQRATAKRALSAFGDGVRDRGAQLAAAFGVTEIQLIDDMSDEEWQQGIDQLTNEISDHRVVSIDDSTTAIQLPMGAFDEDTSNPLLAVLFFSALCHIMEDIMGGRTLHKRFVKSIELRGCRGCAIHFEYETPCRVL